ncbi:host attachment protein [Caldimonas tepidiphila]|uniref:host attachment protein n=1 Tax=Caldimonas tepidiphila TaxID=2315841 RepID=UPI000E5BC159|nr:host attachment protein [Caldimonas tepidiphila]
MKKIWVVVADEAIARILEWPQGGGELQSVEELTDPDAHASGSDLQRDAYGRRAAGVTHGARQNTPHRLNSVANIASSAGEDNQHLEAEGFARRVVQHLTEARQQGRFDELRIVAAPRFLGMLRKYINNQISPTITDEIDKDLIHMQNSEITQRLFPRPPAA